MDAQLSAENRPSRRMQKSLDRLGAVQGVHEDSLASVLNLVNPFPDYAPKRVGWPDTKAGASVCIVDLYETTLKQPTGLAAGDTWDLHVSCLPQCFSADRQLITVSPWALGPPQAQKLASLNCQTWPTGTPAHNLLAGSNIVDQYSYGPLAQGAAFRVVAQGLELVNTSAQLYKGGSSYAYRFSTPVSLTAPYTVSSPNSPTTQAGAGLMELVAALPTDPSEIVDWPNTFIGSAQDGLYVINTPVDQVNEARGFAGRGVGYVDDPSDLATDGVGSAYCGGHNGWNMCGAFMTGLAQGSSILVKHRVYLEIFPSTLKDSESFSLIRLTNPTVPYSPVILEVLAQVLRDMPAGCRYIDNPLGEWFQSILDKIATYAPVVGAALTPLSPLAPIIGSAVGKGAAMIRGLPKSKTKATSSAKKKN